MPPEFGDVALPSLADVERKVNQMTKRFLLGMLAGTVCVGLTACGGGSGSSSPTAPSTPAPTPAATVEASGAGYLTLHPSRYTTWAAAVETPVRIRETAGGTCDWNWARLSVYRGGVEIERSEVGADAIREAGFTRIAARSDEAYTLIFRVNASDFDRWDVTLGFADIRDGRQFEAQVPFSSFSGLDLSFVPLSVPSTGAVRLPQQ